VRASYSTFVLALSPPPSFPLFPYTTLFRSQEVLRRQSLEEIKKLGINPYPAEEFKINVTAADILENYQRDKLNYKNIQIAGRIIDRKSTRLNSSHVSISYAVFCLKKKSKKQ